LDTLKQEQSVGTTRQLASYLAGLRFEDLPPEVVQASKVFVLDLLGATLGAMHTEEVRMASEVVRGLGGHPECTVIGLGYRTSCPNAAFMNGLSSHVLELDDTHRDSITHVGAPVIPAALAMAEREGRSGRTLLTAVVAGYEATLRIANAVQPSHWRRGFLSMGTCGTFGAATAASHCLGMGGDALANALGLAGIQAAGLNSSIYGDGDMGKRLCPSHAASAGILSALLAQKGFTGSTNVVEQRKGFCAAFADDYDLPRVTEGLGKTFEISRTSLKPYSCCRYNHAAIDGLLHIVNAESIGADAIESIRVRTYDIAVTNRPHRAHPKTLFDAKMSLPFCLAVAAYERRAGERDFTEELLGDPSLCGLAERVTVEADEDMSRVFPQQWPAHVQVILRDGRSFERLVPYPKGEPEAPMTGSEIEDKFRDLATVAVTEAAVDTIIRAVHALDRSPGPGALLDAIAHGLKT
jgi:2-methylcitrate dehydratase PrpD